MWRWSSYPTQMTIQYGNGDTRTAYYTAGKPVSRAIVAKRPRKTATSYAYQRSGNFHAYATVSLLWLVSVWTVATWQALDDRDCRRRPVDPLLVRVWWVDVGRVAGDLQL